MDTVESCCTSHSSQSVPRRQCDKVAVSRCQPHLRVTSKKLMKELMKHFSDLSVGEERSRWEARRSRIQIDQQPVWDLGPCASEQIRTMLVRQTLPSSQHFLYLSFFPVFVCFTITAATTTGTRLTPTARTALLSIRCRLVGCRVPNSEFRYCTALYYANGPLPRLAR
jgi:hypothetical protein